MHTKLEKLRRISMQCCNVNMDLKNDIHSCSKIVAENSELKQKIRWLMEKREALQQELTDITKRLDVPKSGHRCTCHFSHRDIGVQTEARNMPSKTSLIQVKKSSKDVHDSDVLKTNKVIEMHSQLLKRYDKEVQLNMSYADTISDLNIRLSECEKKLREEKEKSFLLERDLILWKGRRKGQLNEDMVSDDTVLRDVVRERNKFAKENKAMRKELKSLDIGFFDEIEDIKFALKQSVELNKKYESSLRKLCHQFGIPFYPEKMP